MCIDVKDADGGGSTTFSYGTEFQSSFFFFFLLIKGRIVSNKNIKRVSIKGIVGTECRKVRSERSRNVEE